jgi:hypothetical protein
MPRCDSRWDLDHEPAICCGTTPACSFQEGHRVEGELTKKANTATSICARDGEEVMRRSAGFQPALGRQDGGATFLQDRPWRRRSQNLQSEESRTAFPRSVPSDCELS